VERSTERTRKKRERIERTDDKVSSPDPLELLTDVVTTLNEHVALVDAVVAVAPFVGGGDEDDALLLVRVVTEETRDDAAGGGLGLAVLLSLVEDLESETGVSTLRRREKKKRW
jgi:hypothetical protein